METTFIDTKLKGVRIIKPLMLEDKRGVIIKPFISNDLRMKVKQAYHAHSYVGVIRGMCYCKADKLVYCTRGAVLDIVQDIKTGEFITQGLSQENGLAIFIPAGYAHGYQALEDSTVNYLQTRVWNPDEEKKVPTDGLPWYDI